MSEWLDREKRKWKGYPVESQPDEETMQVVSNPSSPRGKHVAIVGLGPSSRAYLDITKAIGGRHRYCDETWVINSLGDVLACDLVFHMDDVRIQQVRSDAAPDTNIAAMLEWLKTYRGRVITSRAHPDYPSLEEFPLQAMLNDCPNAYFNSTAAYAVAYAVLHRVRKITIFGNDFTYPNAHDAEKGRACVEFWLGVAGARGIDIAMPKSTTLMDACEPFERRFYGYDTLKLDIERNAEGRIVVSASEREALPSASEIEERYDHTKHPNSIVEQHSGTCAA